MNKLPANANVLLCIINTKLRDYYSSLDSLCEDLVEDKNEIINILNKIGYHYDSKLNKFIRL